MPIGNGWLGKCMEADAYLKRGLCRSYEAEGMRLELDKFR